MKGLKSAGLAGLLATTAMLNPAFAAPADDVRTHAGNVVVEKPTLLSLGFEWKIEGDANRNSAVDIYYRKAGQSEWRKGLPMLRMGGEFIAGPKPQYGEQNYYNYTVASGFAGSVLGLEPDTEYETRLVLSDPDGVTGPTERLVQVRTRKEPMPAEGGRVFHVYPFEYAGPKQEPAFTGLLHAYFLGADESDHSNVMGPRVQPGDTILMHAGRVQGQPVRLRRQLRRDKGPGLRHAV
jgi:hypothetical protein